LPMTETNVCLSKSAGRRASWSNTVPRPRRWLCSALTSLPLVDRHPPRRADHVAHCGPPFWVRPPVRRLLARASPSGSPRRLAANSVGASAPALSHGSGVLLEWLHGASLPRALAGPRESGLSGDRWGVECQQTHHGPALADGETLGSLRREDTAGMAQPHASSIFAISVFRVFNAEFAKAGT
jgi:hypothetical protein